jgi:hypothetical protein
MRDKPQETHGTGSELLNMLSGIKELIKWHKEFAHAADKPIPMNQGTNPMPVWEDARKD